MSNQVELKLVITRHNSKQCQVRFFRNGHGDDLVEHRADQFEVAIQELAEKLCKRDGGKLEKSG